MAVLAHPDDESLGVGGTLAKYASEGVDVFLLTATRGDSGRFRGYRLDDHRHSAQRRWRKSVKLSCAPPPQLWVCGKSHLSTTTISISIVRIPARLSPTLSNTSGGSDPTLS